MQQFASLSALWVVLGCQTPSRLESGPARADVHPPESWNRELPLSDQADQGHWKVYSPLSEDFSSGELDASKWFDKNPFYSGNVPYFFDSQAVSCDASGLHLRLKRLDSPSALAARGYGNIAQGILFGKSPILYGYFEAKAKPAASRGDSAFWLAANHGDWHSEIDVFEIGGGAPGFERRDNIHVHVFKTPTSNTHWKVGDFFELDHNWSSEYHIFGLDWNSREIRWFVDGSLVRSIENTDWHQPLELRLNIEASPDWFGTPDESDFASSFDVEYVRAWRGNGKLYGATQR